MELHILNGLGIPVALAAWPWSSVWSFRCGAGAGLAPAAHRAALADLTDHRSDDDDNMAGEGERKTGKLT